MSIISPLRFEEDCGFVDKLHTVVETEQFMDSVNAANVSAYELKSIVSTLATNPMAGQVMLVRWGTWLFRYKSWYKGMGRRYRIVTFFAGSHMPVFLIDIFADGEKLTYSRAEREQLHLIFTRVSETYGRQPKCVRPENAC